MIVFIPDVTSVLLLVVISSCHVGLAATVTGMTGADRKV
jgi:hypothetical protein